MQESRTTWFNVKTSKEGDPLSQVLLELLDALVGVGQLGLVLLLGRQGIFELLVDLAEPHLAVHLAALGQRLDQRLDVDLKALRQRKVGVAAALVQHHLGHALLDQFVVRNSVESSKQKKR